MRIQQNQNIITLDKYTESSECLWLEHNLQLNYNEATDGESDFKIFKLSNTELEEFLKIFPMPEKREIICKITVPLEKEELFLKFFNDFLKNNSKHLQKFTLDSYTVKE